MEKPRNQNLPQPSLDGLEEDQQAMQSVEPQKKTGNLEAGRKRINYESLIGSKFNMLTIVGISKEPKNRTSAKCICDCGNNWTGSGLAVVLGKTKSCGCLNDKKLKSERATRHGHWKHELYQTWENMIKRCYNEKRHDYSYYGGRGIRVSDAWRFGVDGMHPFLIFLQDMGEKPSESHSIDRIDNNGGYSAENCRWADVAQQSVNKRNVVWIHLPDESLSLSEFCRKFHKGRSAIIRRMRKLGITLNEAALMP